jgi:hypothetical protein
LSEEAAYLKQKLKNSLTINTGASEEANGLSHPGYGTWPAIVI